MDHHTLRTDSATKRVSVVVAAVILLSTLVGAIKVSRLSVDGVWRVDEVSVGARERRPAAGLYIFKDGYFSAVRSDKDRGDALADLSVATAAQWNELCGAAFTAQAGTFSIVNSLITLHPLVAKIPSNATPHSYVTYRFSGDLDHLTLSRVGTLQPLSITLTRLR